MNSWRYYGFFLLLCGSFWSSSAQDIRLKQSDLPYCIPLMQSATQGDGVQYQWWEDDRIIEDGQDFIYIIPADKDLGFYRYEQRVKGVDCDEWMRSNSVLIEVYSESPPDFDYQSVSFCVAFSPQKQLTGYVETLVSFIDATTQQLDVSIYSIDNDDIQRALERASARGVVIRMVYEGALQDYKRSSGTISHQLEALGIDVKYVNKTNHHKFVISDATHLITSSGNWNSKANWRYEDSYLSCSDTDVVLRYRAEFELLWNNSREFGQQYTYTTVSPDSLLRGLSDNPHVEVLFTSSNYKITQSAKNGPTFSKTGNRQNLADRLVQLIEQAQHSIKIASNYLRSRPICEALIDKKKTDPNIEIKVITDQGEYITSSYDDYQREQRELCLSKATTAAKKRDCLEKNFMYSYALIQANIPLRFKVYSYKWHHSTAQLLHHKYALFDDEIVAMGSYNYSYNSETNCMENLIVFNRTAAAAVVDQYVANFEQLWNTGRAEGYYSDLGAYLNSANRYIPLVFYPMALSWEEYSQLKERIERACPAVKHPYFKDNGQKYRSYLKGVKLEYSADNTSIRRMQDHFDGQFALEYTYNAAGDLVATTMQTADSLNWKKEYAYNAQNQLIRVQTPWYTAAIDYKNKSLYSINSGQGDHRWSYKTSADQSLEIAYYKPQRNGYALSSWTKSGFPKSLSMGENQTIQWTMDSMGEWSGITSETGRKDFLSTPNTFRGIADNRDTVAWKVEALNRYFYTNSGTVAATVHYHKQRQDDKQLLNINILASKVHRGPGKMAHIEYVLDPYGRVVKSGDLLVRRKPYSGAITEIKNKQIVERRSYDRWGLLVGQTVRSQGSAVYEVLYQYDGLHRIKQMDETLLGRSTRYDYTYNAQGQLTVVHENGVQSEAYQYDAFGNRSGASSGNIACRWEYNGSNQISRFEVATAAVVRQGHCSYNRAGQLSGCSYTTADSTLLATAYRHDAFGNVLEAETPSGKTSYRYDVFDRKIATYRNDTLQQRWIYGSGDYPLASCDADGRIEHTYVYLEKNRAILMHQAGVAYYLVTDIRGSLRLVINASNSQIAQQLQYDSFGRLLYDSNPGYTPFGFAGGLYEDRGGFVRFGNRNYLAEIAKWTTENPLGFWSGRFNDYMYCSNDPVNLVPANGVDELRVNAPADLELFSMHRVLSAAIGAVGKGKTWGFLTADFPVDLPHRDIPSIYSLNRRVYPHFEPIATPAKINAWNRAGSVPYLPRSIESWYSL
ncbi:phospholipase D-like domain-containing protein [Flavobacterium sp. JP2137]|uniref:phospholipase D-like domain-containing protein n=1 Tax=Flavobacterium sp. JP2137 TaxID=3414510 RepID=UPI003D2FA0E5